MTHIKYLLFLLLLLSCNTTADIILDTSLPPQHIDVNYCDYNHCDFEKEPILPEFVFKDTDLRQEKTVFYTINFLDTLTTWRAVNEGYGRERNPLLPEYPNAGELFLHKLVVISIYEYYGITDHPLLLNITNYGMASVLANNLYIVQKNE